MKKRISLLIMIILLLSGCKPKEFFDPWDDLGGAGNGETGDKYFVNNDKLQYGPIGYKIKKR